MLKTDPFHTLEELLSHLYYLNEMLALYARKPSIKIAQTDAGDFQAMIEIDTWVMAGDDVLVDHPQYGHFTATVIDCDPSGYVTVTDQNDDSFDVDLECLTWEDGSEIGAQYYQGERKFLPQTKPLQPLCPDAFALVGGNLPTDFRMAVGQLRRPYTPICESDYELLLARLKEAQADFFLWRGKLVTIGHADGGYAIMPASEQVAKSCLGSIPRHFRSISTHIRKCDQGSEDRYLWTNHRQRILHELAGNPGKAKELARHIAATIPS
jgi:hypothetical protein